jgi:hypothetical protein
MFGLSISYIDPHSLISGIISSKHTQPRRRHAQKSATTAMKSSRHARCVKPDIPIGGAEYNNSTLWPHQTVNTSCPRFAMLTITTAAGLGQRFQEVNSAEYYSV